MTFTTLQMAAVEGPVIVVNFSESRSDAIIVISKGPPLLIPLPDATPAKMSELSKITNSHTNEKDMRTVLDNLWRLVVQPIVNSLTTDVRLARGSRIWWCPTGAASLLPLHAAGDYNKRGQTLPDWFISSYTTTLTSLIRARDKITLDAFTKPNLLVLGQSQDPTLPKVSLEIRAIHRIIDDVVILDGDSATRDSALQAMAKHSWAHFACHGNVDEERPFKTHFSLFDGPLTLLDIASQNTPDAYLAFLSSCHSAEGNRKRPDEALHLTAGVQFAGFKSVIGTLWAVDGADGPAVAETFYSNLLGRGPKPTKSPAVALHRAVRQLRRKKEGDRVTLTRWACFVHYGC